MFNDIVVQEEAMPIIKELGVSYKEGVLTARISGFGTYHFRFDLSGDEGGRYDL